MRHGHGLGLVSDAMLARLEAKEAMVREGLRFLENVSASLAPMNAYLGSRGLSTTLQKERLSELVKRPGVVLSEVLAVDGIASEDFVVRLMNATPEKLRREIIEQIEIELKYRGYIVRQEIEIDNFRKFESMTIPEEFNFAEVRSLSSEGKEKLSRIRPRSIGQASRISGVVASDVSVLMVHLRR